MKNKFKLAAAGLLAMALVVGVAPVSEGKGIFGGLAVTANAAPPGPGGGGLTQHTLKLYANNGTDESWSESQMSGIRMIPSPSYCGFTTPDNKEFSHWNTAPDGSGTDYSLFSSYSYNNDLTLYAQWFTPVTSVTLNKETAALTEGADETLTATVEPTDAAVKSITWESSDTSVATVDDNGKVSAVKAGTTTITAKVTYGTDYAYNYETATCEITVTASKIAETYTEIDSNTGWCVDNANNNVYLIYRLGATEEELKNYDFISILNAQNETMVPGDELSEGEDGYEGKFNTVYTTIQFPDGSEINAGDNEYLIAFELSGLTTEPKNFTITTGVNE